MIAALVAGTVLAADFAAIAQDSSTNKPPAGARPPGGRGRMNFDYISTQLALTDDQKPKVKTILDDMQKKMNGVRTDDSLQAADKRAKFREIRDNVTTQLKDVLTDEQFQKWQKMMQGTRRGPGGPPPAGGATPPPASGSNPPQQ